METLLNIVIYVSLSVATLVIIFAVYAVYIRIKFNRELNKLTAKYDNKYVDEGRDLDEHWSKQD